MAATFYMKMQNFSTEGWSFVLYQKHPDEDDTTDLAWKVKDLAKPNFKKPTTDSVDWKLEYMVTIATETDGIYSINESPGFFFPAKDGYKYAVATDGESLLISEVGPGHPGYITLTNMTETPLNLGLALSGTLLAVRKQVPSTETANFKILTEYYLGLFSNFDQGSIMSFNFDLGPVLIKFINGYNTVCAEAFFQNGVNVLSTPTYSKELIN